LLLLLGLVLIHMRYGIKASIIPYIAAIFTGYSRVASNRHYTHDVIAGAIEDATEGLNPVCCQALADGCDNRDSPTDRCLEGNRLPQLPGSFK